MNAEQINSKIYTGRGKAALRLGKDHDVWRPVLAGNPFTNQVATLKCAFNSGDNKYGMPNMPGDPIWFGDFDANLTQVGDYLVQCDDKCSIKYVGAMQPLLPIIVVECNRSIKLSRPLSNTGKSDPSQVGAVAYSGVCDSVGESTDVFGTSPATGTGLSGNFIGWPCSIIEGKGGSRLQHQLPTSALSMYGWAIMLPASIPAIINAGDRLLDDLGRTYSVNGAELTDMGWRIAATEVHQ